MGRRREFLLDSLLAGLVAASLILSARVWFPSDVGERPLREATVQETPQTVQGRMPEVLRPERILVRSTEGKIASLQSGSNAYHYTWRRIQGILFGASSLSGPVLVQEDLPTDEESITLVLPTALPLREWANRWVWNAAVLISPEVEVDRVSFLLGPDPAWYLSGPTGERYRLASLSTAQAEILSEVVAAVDPAALVQYRSLIGAPPTPPDLLVPDVQSVPLATFELRESEHQAYQGWYFPDLSVIRQIDEKDARSFTDGQRLLRFTGAGVMEYRTAESDGQSMELIQSLYGVEDWVRERGGWPQDLVLTRYQPQTGKVRLTFELRTPGPYPIESAEGALILELARSRTPGGGIRISRFLRYPELGVFFGGPQVAIIAPEQALALATAEFPGLVQAEPLRDLYLGYRLGLRANAGGGTSWAVDPVWILQVGTSKVYVPALTTAKEKPTLGGPKI